MVGRLMPGTMRRPDLGGGGGDRVSCGMVMVIHDDRKVFAPCARYGKSG
ncbi:hypothetical protein [Novacetimonas hansenii]|nr:hypothetical protein [Novacetimonas hansenii]WEQ58657.1 hypothetical protein LV563_12595 [Novacetimonas hansenii]